MFGWGGVSVWVDVVLGWGVWVGGCSGDVVCLCGWV